LPEEGKRTEGSLLRIRRRGVVVLVSRERGGGEKALLSLLRRGKRRSLTGKKKKYFPFGLKREKEETLSSAKRFYTCL